MSQSDSVPPTTPIFLFSNWRTGGTALAFSFRAVSAFYVYTEPFNPTLRASDLARKANTSDWRSKHPPNQSYFKEYEPLFQLKEFNFPEVETIPYVLGPSDDQTDVKNYLSVLISFAQNKGLTPVFKFEMMEGAATWIAQTFPTGLRVGLSRDRTTQLISWMEQASFGNHLFFRKAHELIERNLGYFDVDTIQSFVEGDIDLYFTIFDLFKNRLDEVHRRHMHFCLDISPESRHGIPSHLELISEHDPDRLALWEEVLTHLRASLHRQPGHEVALARLTTIVRLQAELGGLSQRIADQDAQIQRQRLQFTEQSKRVDDLRSALTDRERQVDAIVESRTFSLISKLRQAMGMPSLTDLPAAPADQKRSMKEVFTKIFVENHWGSKVSHSGGGSDLTQTRVIREALPKLFDQLGIESMLDLPCGDFYWMSHVQLNVDYTGVDVVDELVRANNEKHGGPRRRFLHLDVSTDNLPKADLIFCRDLLVHFSFEDIHAALANMKRSGSTWLLTTTFTRRSENVNIVTGDWRPLNFLLPPFSFPPPHQLINEECSEFGGDFDDKSLGLWKLGELPI